MLAGRGDPNFPQNLSITASTRTVLGDVGLKEDASDNEDAAQDVQRFGIAGRTWEAAYLLRSYLVQPTLASDASSSVFDPPCPIDARSIASACPHKRKRTVIELGAGTGFLSLSIAPHLASQADVLVMTDLANVCPLLEENLAAARKRWKAQGQSTGEVLVRPLPWGDALALAALQDEGLSPDFVLASDLIYFEFLYAPLLRTLLAMTEPRRDPASQDSMEHDTLEGASPKVIFSYKIRSLVKEQPFWETFGRWFAFEAVQLGTPHPPSPTAHEVAPTPGNDDRSAPVQDDSLIPSIPSTPPAAATSSSSPRLSWNRLGSAMPSSTTTGSTDELFVFVCSRWPSTYGFDATEITDDELMQGWGRARGDAAGAGRFEEMMLAGLEWD